MIRLRNLIAMALIISSGVSALYAGKSSAQRTGAHPERHLNLRRLSSSSLSSLGSVGSSQSRSDSPVEGITFPEEFFTVESYDAGDFVKEVIDSLNEIYEKDEVVKHTPKIRKLVEMCFTPAFEDNFSEGKTAAAVETLREKLSILFRRASLREC